MAEVRRVLLFQARWPGGIFPLPLALAELPPPRSDVYVPAHDGCVRQPIKDRKRVQEENYGDEADDEAHWNPLRGEKVMLANSLERRNALR